MSEAHRSRIFASLVLDDDERIAPAAAPESRRSYTPPYPPRPNAQAPSWRILGMARRNLLSVWPDFTYERGSFSANVLTRRIHIVSTPDVVREVFVDKADCVARKTAQQRRALAPLAGDGLIISDGDTWRLRRRAVAPVTHVSRLPALAQAMSAGAADLVRRWSALPAGTELDIGAEMARLAAKIIVDAIFGRGVDAQLADRIVKAFGTYQQHVRQIDLLSLFGGLDGLPRLSGLRAAFAARRIRRDLDEMVAAILDGDPSEPSLIRAMAETEVDSRPAMDRVACRNEAAVMFLAGHETTANTMAFALFILSQDADSGRRLHAEVDAVLGDRPAGFDDLGALPFTRAVVQETLRLYPPVPIQGRLAARDFFIGGKAVAAGDIVMLNAWILHRHRDVWSEPDAFVPDRFLAGGPASRQAQQSRYAYVPFGIGPRVCTGAAFGQTEAIICLATLMRHFRLRLRPGHRVEPICRLSLRPGHTLPMTIEPRA